MSHSYPGAGTKSFTVTFPKVDGIGSNVVVTVSENGPDTALAVARAALVRCAGQAVSAITVA